METRKEERKNDNHSTNPIEFEFKSVNIAHYSILSTKKMHLKKSKRDEMKRNDFGVGAVVCYFFLKKHLKHNKNFEHNVLNHANRYGN